MKKRSAAHGGRAALGVGICTVGRARKRLVTRGMPRALDPRPQPAGPGNVKIKGDIEQRLVQPAGGDRPDGDCRWTLRLPADETVALGPAGSVSTEAVRQALNKTTRSPGPSRPGAPRPRPTSGTSGGWKT